MNANDRCSLSAVALAWWFGVAALIAACGGGSDNSAPALQAPAPGPVPGPGPGPGPALTPPPIAQTQAGDPEGLPNFATIGAAGGTLVSSDGRLTVDVPAGALTTDTEIGIAPIVAKAPGSLGSDYRLTPEGLTFAQPVTLTFTHSATEAAAAWADSLRVATRDSRGRWVVAGATRDAAQRKTSVTMTHFSDWSLIAGLQIAPASAAVLINKDLVLKVVDCGDAPDPDDAGAPPVLRECRSLAVGTETSNWSVNGIVNGNAAVGTMKSMFGLAGYLAPGAVPDQNPVAVSTEVMEVVPWLMGAYTTRLVSNVLVVDHVHAYEGTAFGTVVSPYQTLRTSANLRFVHNPELSTGGALWYDGVGTAHVHAKPSACTSGSGRAAVSEATLQVFTEGPLAGTYQLSVGAKVDVTMTCGDPPTTVTIPIVGAIGAAGTDICPAVQIGNDAGRLAGSWSCNAAEGTRGTANWTLRATE